MKREHRKLVKRGAPVVITSDKPSASVDLKAPRAAWKRKAALPRARLHSWTWSKPRRCYVCVRCGLCRLHRTTARGWHDEVFWVHPNVDRATTKRPRCNGILSIDSVGPRAKPRKGKRS